MKGVLSLITICVLCLWSWNHVVVSSLPFETGPGDTMPVYGRYKRSMPTVLGKLLARAKLLMNTPGYKLYSRPGNYARAKADFIALQLTDVRPLQFGYEGHVDDWTVVVKYFSNKGGDAYIDIMKATKTSDGEHGSSSINRIRYYVARERPPAHKRLKIN